MMHNGMLYDLIQGQGDETLKVGNSAIFKMYLLSRLVFVSRDFKVRWSRKIAKPVWRS